MTNDDLRGVLRPDDGRAAVRFERTYDTTCEDLWSALTEPDRLARWFAPVTGDLAPGGSYTIDFGNDVTSGTVLACEPPRRLKLTWELPGEPPSRLLATLDDRDGQAHLVLDHALLPLNQVGGYAAGWHAYLVRLVAALRRETVPQWSTVYAMELDSYRTLAAGVAG